MGEILSSISLLLAIESIALGLWHAEIQACIDLPKAVDKDAKPSEKKVAQKRASATLNSKAIPLVLLTIPTALIFTPRWIVICVNTLGRWQEFGWTLFYRFDPVATAYCWIVLLSWALGLYALTLLIRLRKSYSRLKALSQGKEGASTPAGTD